MILCVFCFTNDAVQEVEFEEKSVALDAYFVDAGVCHVSCLIIRRHVSDIAHFHKIFSRI
jgi:hypothetical protein